MLAIQHGVAAPGSPREGQRSLTRARPAPRPSPTGQRYLPGLDGMRALAVIAVVLFHSTLGIAPGGFLGVEVFFVISGYIITRALLAEREGSGRIALGRFWLRRARRLLPALFLLLLVVAGYSVLFAESEVADLRHDIAAALAYVTNWDLIVAGETYFDSWERPSLLRHLWSLAVEEQFYLVWPLLIAGGLAALRKRLTFVLIVAGAAASALAMAELYEPGSTARIYYGTDTRASGLLIGSALAFVWSAGPAAVRNGRARAAAGQAALLLLGLTGLATLASFTLLLDGGSAFLYRGGFVLVGLATAALIVAATHERSLVARGLGAPLLRWLGVRSYGIYLWHWPVMTLTRPGVDVPLDGVGLFALQLAITLALAEGSYRWVELPVRTGALGRLRQQLREWTERPRRQRGALAFASASSLAAVGAVAAFVTLAQPPQEPPYFALESVRLVNTSATADATARVGAPPAPTKTAPPASGHAHLPTAAPADLLTPLAHAAAGTGVAPKEEEAPAVQTLALSEQAASVVVLTVAFAAERDAAQHEPAAFTESAGAAVRVTAVGDSVMLGAAHQLATSVPNIDLDAALGRQVRDVITLLREREANGQLGEIVLLHIGNNGLFSDAEFDRIMEVTGPERRVIFLTLKVARVWEEANNAVIARGVDRHPRAILVDWRAAIEERPDALWSDGTHLRPEGASYYVELLAPHMTS